MSVTESENARIARETQSGFQEVTGYVLTRWSEGEAEFILDIAHRHRNRNGYVHGGIFMALLDAACGHAACWCSDPGNVRRTMTISFATNFLGAAREGRLTARAVLRGGGRKTVGCSGEIVDADGRLLATAQGTYRYFPGSENIEGVPRDAPA